MITYNNRVYKRGWHDWHFKITYPRSINVTIRARTLPEAIRKFKKKHRNVSYRVTHLD